MEYNGTLVMPRNCVAMTEDEMTYTEGGATVLSTSSQWYGTYKKVKYTGNEIAKLIIGLSQKQSSLSTLVKNFLIGLVPYVGLGLSVLHGAASSAVISTLIKMNGNNSGVTMGQRNGLAMALWDVWDNY
ncbi:MAG: hypothetical protein LBN34_06160 [Clostridiales Family XIII bacterium]|jgi:hypothetical protein|nr:hypothetical protein [Clostridiales Family XIII bacterium]